MIAERPRARVTLERRRLWTVRAALVLARWLVYALVLAAMASAVRAAAAAAPVESWRPGGRPVTRRLPVTQRVADPEGVRASF